MDTIGYAATDSKSTLAPWEFSRRDARENDVVMEILYCGVCHSDLHFAHNDWGNAKYPAVPGHEIVGRVIEVGAGVTKFKVGDVGAVGCMVDSCQTCDQCRKGEEQFCRTGSTGTYGGTDRIDGTPTYGGYSKHIVVRQEFVCTIPEGVDLSRVAPVLCAGITTWSPLRHWNVGPTSRVGVIGMGGLGHMAVKLAAALGAEVTVISRGDKKKDKAFAIGADHYVDSKDKGAMMAASASLDLILDTVPVQHEVVPYMSLLDVNGTHVILGQIGPLQEFSSLPFFMGRKSLAASPIGGMVETQEVIDFCARKGILPECRMIKPDEINMAFETLEQADIAYRFVIDMSGLDVPAA